MKKDIGGIAYSKISPSMVLSLLDSLKSLESPELGSVELSVFCSVPPEWFEFSARQVGSPLEFVIQGIFLPIDSNEGPAFQIAYLWKVLPPSLFEQLGDQIADLLISTLNELILGAGARRVQPFVLTVIEGDNYGTGSIRQATTVVAAIVCSHQELRDPQTGVVVANWYGSLSWCSPQTGVVAGHFYYAPPGAPRKRLFVRWHFYWVDALKREFVACYECSAAHANLHQIPSIEWEIIKELIRQTSYGLVGCGATRTATEVGPTRAVITQFSGEDSSVSVSLQSETSRSSYWPSLQDYNEAIQNLSHCMGDRELRQGTLHVQQFGLPYVVSGAFACVYRVSCGERSYAVRCFATPIRDQAERYKRMGGFICGDNLSYTMDFQFVEKGIMLRGEWFPIVKMEWVEGESLGAYISRNLNDPVALTKMRRKFLLMVLELEREGVAHGDLQHGNIIIRNDELILVDYDGMFVPDLAGFVSREKGHRNYQHPARGPQHFGRYLDNFSAWLIDTALYAISLDSSFWSVFHEGDECMLFRAKDLLLPNESLLFRVLHAHKAGDLSRRGEYLRMLLSAPVEEIPPLGPGYPPLAIQEKSAGIPAWMIQ